MFFEVKLSASTKLILTLVLFFIPACSKASLIDLYESFNSVYFPTKDTVTSFSGSNLAFTTLFQSFNWACLVFIFNFFKIVLSTFWL